jgi:DNA-binding transcriptional regulator YdaS (Cro superfamily)
MTETAVNPHVRTAIELCDGKQSILAERLGCAQQTVSKLLRGEIQIDATWAVRISKATDGLLKPQEMCPELAEALR